MFKHLILMAVAASALCACGGSGNSGPSNPYPGTYGGKNGNLSVYSDDSFSGTLAGYGMTGNIQSNGSMTGTITSAPNNIPPAGTPMTGTVTVQNLLLTLVFSYTYTSGSVTENGGGTIQVTK